MANFDLNKLMEGKNPQSVMLAKQRGLKNKWEKTGLLEGLQERDQHQMVLLENQAKQLLDEANATSNGSGNEEWNGVALPLVRRIFGEIAAKNFVSVQPMNLPSGLIFYLDFKYNNQQFGGTQYSGSSLFGGDGSDLGSTNVAKNGLYGSGRYGYTLNDQSVDVAAEMYLSQLHLSQKLIMIVLSVHLSQLVKLLKLLSLKKIFHLRLMMMQSKHLQLILHLLL